LLLIFFVFFGCSGGASTLIQKEVLSVILGELATPALRAPSASPLYFCCIPKEFHHQ
jgi:hypothetical protein